MPRTLSIKHLECNYEDYFTRKEVECRVDFYVKVNQEALGLSSCQLGARAFPLNLTQERKIPNRVKEPGNRPRPKKSTKGYTAIVSHEHLSAHSPEL